MWKVISVVLSAWTSPLMTTGGREGGRSSRCCSSELGCSEADKSAATRAQDDVRKAQNAFNVCAQLLCKGFQANGSNDLPEKQAFAGPIAI